MNSNFSKFSLLGTQHTETHLETHKDGNESGEKNIPEYLSWP